jgi:hypothetical protein
MGRAELENLAERGLLKREQAAADQIDRQLGSGLERLADARRRSNSLRSRFDLAYNAAHAFALVALWRAGYRSESRYLAFQALAHTLSLPPATWRLLATAHRRRNEMEYEGVGEPSERLTEDTIDAAQAVLDGLRGSDESRA